jgi:type I restriction enzyme S subunit
MMNDEIRMTNAELPEGWAKTKLEDIARDVTYGYTAKSNRTSGGAKMLRITDIQDNRVDWSQVPFCAISAPDKAKYLLKKWDLVFARTGATVGKSFLIRDDVSDSVFASYLIRVRCLEQEMTRYLSYFFNSPAYWDQITDFSAGIGQPNVNGSKLKGLSIPIAPLAEQKRIADKLEAVLGRVDACRARLDRVPALLKRFRQSVLAAATSGKLTEEWREENPPDKAGEPLLNMVLKHRDAAWKKSGKKGACPEAPKSAVSELHDLPVGWSWIPLGVIGVNPLDTVQTGPFGAQLHKEEFVSKGVPVVAVGNLTGMGFTERGLYFITEKKASDLSRYDIQAGDVLFARSGATLGKVCVTPPDAKDWRMTGHILRARLNRTYLLPEFCVFALRGDPAVTLQVFGGVQGSTRPGYNTTLLESIQLPVPPLPEQQEIVRRVEDLFAFGDRIEARLATAQKTVERLTPATLAKAFRGELAPQDPNDEPASALLERLKSAQPIAKPAKAKRTKRT